MFQAWLWIFYAALILLSALLLLLEPTTWRRRVFIILAAVGLLCYITVNLVDKMAAVAHPV